jgi:sigma-B regulation protein RsbU (phosphoserine phosphatase)
VKEESRYRSAYEHKSVWVPAHFLKSPLRFWDEGFPQPDITRNGLPRKHKQMLHRHCGTPIGKGCLGEGFMQTEMMIKNMTLLPRILIADDQPDVCAALRLLLKSEGFETETVSSPDAVLTAVAARDYDLVLMDLNYTRDTTSGVEGIDLLSRLRALNADMPVVAMTAWGSMEVTLSALREGVTDFILKPWDNTLLVATLRKHQMRHQQARTAQASQAREFADAHALQKSLLPTSLPQADGYELAATWQPARAVGGDYYDAWQLDDGRLAFCLGDVMGKGMPAALLMAHLQAAVHAHAQTTAEPAALLTTLNQVMHQATQGARFVTLFFALYDPRTRRLRYTNAGHNAPLLVNDDNQTMTLQAGGLPLGAFIGRGYEQGGVQLRSGDRLLLCTDGVTECCDAAGQDFGEERLQQIMTTTRGDSAQAICDNVAQALQQFNGSQFQDDATWLAFTVR